MKNALITVAALICIFTFSSGWLVPASAAPGPVKFSMPHGFYYLPFTVTLSGATSGSRIYCTTDGSKPSTRNGMLYTAPILIKTTTVLRAVAIDEQGTGTIATCSYIFPEAVASQPDNPAGYPSMWGKYTDISGVAKADYGMDPDIVNHPDYRELVIPALLSVPSVSIVMKKEHLFSATVHPDSGGIYIYTGANGKTGDNWERPVSAELIIPGSAEGFQVNCGMQIQGGASRLAEKSPKHSFRLAFRDSLGPAKLRYNLFGEDASTVFNGLVLRASFGNTWRHWESAQRLRASHVQDIWAKETQLEMGHLSAHSRFVHLYLNGLYWGLYNLSERIDDDFMAGYLGGNKEQYDIVKDYNELMNGSREGWDYLWGAVNGQLYRNEVYQKLIGNNPDGSRNPSFPVWIDPVNLCDYMLINFYGGNNDWDHHNWVAGRNRETPATGFTFHCWDTEKILENLNENYVTENNAQRPSGIFSRLMGNREFRMLFADRVNLHMRNQGALTPGKAVGRWLKIADIIDTALVAESARWGDYRRDVHSWSSGPYLLYTVNDHWMAEKKRLITSYFPERTQVVLNQLKSAGMIPKVEAPQFNQYGGLVTNGFRLTMTAETGLVWYTLDGSDPRLSGGKVNPAAMPFLGPVKTGAVTEVKARTKMGDEWSALTSATFFNEHYQPGEVENTAENSTLLVFPNPLKESAWLRFYLPERGDVTLAVFRPDGRCLVSLPKGFMEKGEHLIYWAPESLTSGVYLLSLSAGRYQERKKIMIIR